MIASLLAASLLLGQQNLDDYLPGGPDRVHAEALEWLERATERWADAEGLKLVYEEVVDGEPVLTTAWIRRESAFQLDPRPIPPPLGHNRAWWHSAWESPPLRGNLGITAWLGEVAPPYSSLRVEIPTEPDIAARLHWVRDGSRGVLDLSDDGTPLAWMGKRVVGIHEFTKQTLPERMRDWQLRPWPGSPGVAATPSNPSAWLTSQTAESALLEILQRTASARAIRIRGQLEISIGSEEEGAIQIGAIEIDGSLYWPSYGKISMRGELGPPGEEKPVHTSIQGNGKQYWHWNHLDDELRPIPGMSELLAGMQGMLPLYSWAARSVPAEGWHAEWMTSQGESRWLRVIDGPTTSEFRIEHSSIQELVVRSTGARPGAPTMHYRSLVLEPEFEGGYYRYFKPSVDELNARLRLIELDEARKDPRTEELLPIGERAPSAVAWQTLQGASESLEALRGKPVVLCLWYRDATSCEPALRHLSRLRARLDRIGARSHFRAIAVDEASGDVPAWLEDRSIVLPVGVSSSAQLKRAFRARWLPTTYLIGVDGVVLGRWLGVPNRELEEQLQSLLDRN